MHEPRENLQQLGIAMAQTVPEKIIAECAIAFGTNSDDCNKYLKTVSAVFFEPDLFTGPGMNADAIVAELRKSKDWSQLGTSHANAIRDAKAGGFVVAGMTSSELSSSNGHLAVVVGDDGQMSGTVLVPICYAGSLNATARVQRKRVSETFGATFAREGKISYFSRTPQTVPKDTPVTRLVDFMRGVRVDPELEVFKKTAPPPAPIKTISKPRKRRSPR
jgi:hypothetical protein